MDGVAFLGSRSCHKTDRAINPLDDLDRKPAVSVASIAATLLVPSPSPSALAKALMKLITTS
jgi:hypothetical protein